MQSSTYRRTAGFTFLELMLVIAIISILTGMIFAVVNMARTAGYSAKTKSIMQIAMNGISLASSQGVTISPIPHPLANSSCSPSPLTRSLFLRGAGCPTQYSVAQPVDLIGEALVVKDPGTVDTSVLTRVLLPTDVYCGLTAPSTTDAPQFFGLDRQHMTILGSGLGLITYRRLPQIASWNDQNGDGILDNPPYTSNPGSGVKYPDSVYLENALGDITDNTAFEISNKKSFDYLLGAEIQGEIAQIGGIKTADTGQALLSNYRLRANAQYAGTTSSVWNATQYKGCNAVLDTDGNWKAYQLRGTAIYDAWGHEVLFFLAANGSFSFESAGADGVFRWNPGADGIFQTGATDSAPSGDDLDGTKDNITTGLQ